MHRIVCTSAAVQLLTNGAFCAGVARFMGSAVEAIDCSGEGDLYEPLVGLRVGALFGILAVSSIGVFLPFFTYTAKLNKAYFLVRAFAGGVVLVTGFVHVLGDAIPLLSDPCLGLSTEFPWALVFTSFAAMFAFTLEWSLTQYFKHKLPSSTADSSPDELESGLDMQVLDDKQLERRRLRYVVISTTFEAGVIFHSIFIGITIGISSSADTVRSLMIALMFHQACEGLALGVTFVKAEYSVLKYCFLGLLFLVVTPVGIAIGMGVGNSYQSKSKVALGFEGAFNSLSAGILIYNGLVDLIVPTFGPEELPVQSWLQGLGLIFMFAGGAVMSLIAKWA
ncbi:low-affinity Zn(2+) transporter zrt2 [Trebouxia sp. C0010 RCD-2024]